MPILNPTTQESLIPLVEKYNLIPHDKTDERICALYDILKQDIKDKKWLHHDLKPQLQEYGVKYSTLLKDLLQEQKSLDAEDLDHHYKRL